MQYPEGKDSDDMPCGKEDAWKRERFAEYWKEKREHPRMSESNLWMIVNDHFKNRHKKR